MLKRLINLLFPPKCKFCRRVLLKNETDLCHSCRIQTPEFNSEKRKAKHVADWTAVWYYRGRVIGSLKRYKFWNARRYADFYGRMLALKLLDCYFLQEVDLITWAPVSKRRRQQRGYDQSYLIAKAVAQELEDKPLVSTLQRKHTVPISSIRNIRQRQYAISGAYSCPCPEAVQGKTILVIDDIFTTGSTSSEIGKTLLAAGAAKVYLGVVASAQHEFKHK